jgi:mevalonate kinase
MKYPHYSIEVPGKWVLSGEHSVLRGGLAVALPHPHFRLALRFHPQPGGGLLTAPSEAKELAGALVDQVFALAGRSSQARPEGLLEIQSTIPFGAGLGSSAALCVALVRWLSEPLGIELARVGEIATRLEDRFHGKSSGMDVAVTSLGRAIRYRIEDGQRCADPIQVSNLPRFTFHDMGLRKKTNEAIAKVERFRFEHPARGEEIDQRMMEASRMVVKALEEREPDFERLAEAMRLGQSCYREWDLIPEAAAEIERKLLSEGAAAVKLTGAGGGGFLVALWRPGL